jgi:hypothetical protein
MANTSKGNNNGAEDTIEGARSAAINVMVGAQERLRSGAGQMAEKLPDALAGAQVAARDTQKALDSMPDQTLLVGASFSLGLAVGMFFAGANRLLVLLALAPAAAMAATLFGRTPEQEASAAGQKRRAAAG